MPDKKLNHWRIVAGHKERDQPDDVKSVQLGDWLRKNYIATGHGKGHFLHKVFSEKMRIGDQVVVTTDAHLWAIGIVTSDVYRKKVSSDSYLYEFRRDVVWGKLMKIPHSRFPDSLRRKLGIEQALSSLTDDDWATLLIFV